MNSNDIIKKAEKDLAQQFEKIDEIRNFNQEKVLKAFIDNKICPEYFYSVSGYGHDDMGRDALDRVFAQTFNAEKAIVRPHFVSGTHALACCLFGCLRYGDKLISVAGSPYDTMQEVIGTRGDKHASLIGHGVLYNEIPLLNENEIDLQKLEKTIDETCTMVLIQRSRGYSLRHSLSVSEIENIIKIVKSKNPNCICFVDNCYGEFVEKQEPTDVGADLIAGSLVKNAGGGIVEAGGYIAGKEKFVDMAAQRLTAPGIGAEGGAMFNQTRLFYQGFFMAPEIVSNAVKSAVLASKIFEDIGFETTPKSTDLRTDIIQTIAFRDKQRQEDFCKNIQKLSPINSFVTPIAENIPGYEDKVIMAGGSFVEGSTIELSADGPVREPYAVYMQGALTYAHARLVLKKFLEHLN